MKHLFLAAVMVLLSGTSALADPLPPFAVPPEAQPPALGDGPVPPAVAPGDGGPPPAVPTGQHDPSTGSRFSTVPGANYKTTKDWYRNSDRSILKEGQSRGLRKTMQTPGSGNEFGDAALENYLESKYPYPQKVKNATVHAPGLRLPDWLGDMQSVERRRDKIEVIDRPGKVPLRPRDAHNRRWEQEEAEAPLPIVKIFARKLVIAGMVFGTVLMAFASFSVVLGHREGGARVIGCAAGLMLLLMGYSIYKVVMVNAFGYTMMGASYDVVTQQPPQSLAPPDPPPADPAPVAPIRPPRSGMEVAPYANFGP